MAISKSIFAIGLVILLVVGFGTGLITSPLILPQNAQPGPTASPSPTQTPFATDTVWANIQATDKIKIGTDPNWPPYEYLDSSGKIVGFEVDLVDAIAEKLGLDTEWIDMGFDTILTSVQAKSIDMGVSGFSITANRLEQVKFTMYHSITRGQVIMLQSTKEAHNITELQSLADLKTLGLTAGTQIGTTEQEELEAAGISNKAFGDFAMAFQDMVSANPSVDCVYAETPITTNWIANNAQGKDIATVYDIPYYPCAFLVNKDATTFLEKFDGAFADLIASGEFDEIKERWQV